MIITVSVSHKYEKSKNYYIKSQKYGIKTWNYEILCHYYDFLCQLWFIRALFPSCGRNGLPYVHTKCFFYFIFYCDCFFLWARNNWGVDAPWLRTRCQLNRVNRGPGRRNRQAALVRTGVADWHVIKYTYFHPSNTFRSQAWAICYISWSKQTAQKRQDRR